jgi:hypothetical protein
MMPDRADAVCNSHLPSLPCHARLVLALESALLSHRSAPPRLEAAVCECVADLKAQSLTPEQVLATITELVHRVSCSAWMGIPPGEVEALAAQIVEWSAAAYQRTE